MVLVCDICGLDRKHILKHSEDIKIYLCAQLQLLYYQLTVGV